MDVLELNVSFDVVWLVALIRHAVDVGFLEAHSQEHTDQHKLTTNALYIFQLCECECQCVNVCVYSLKSEPHPTPNTT